MSDTAQLELRGGRVNAPDSIPLFNFTGFKVIADDMEDVSTDGDDM